MEIDEDLTSCYEPGDNEWRLDAPAGNPVAWLRQRGFLVIESDTRTDPLPRSPEGLAVADSPPADLS
jgi:hypothetical protein